MTEHSSTPQDAAQPLSDRVENRSQRPDSAAFQQFMASQWAEAEPTEVERAPVADFAAERRRRISERFPGERLVLPAGPLKVRSNDTD